MGARRAFHAALGGNVTAAKTADFLILNPLCPRSLIDCVSGMVNHLARLAKTCKHEAKAQTVVQKMLSQL